MAAAQLSLDNPVFQAYTLSVGVLGLKNSFNHWHQVQRMITSGLGNVSSEDVDKGIVNPDPKGDVQLKPYEPVERLRRIARHDAENNGPFFAVGLLYVATDAGPEWPIYVYTGTKLLHHVLYMVGRAAGGHTTRAATWTVTSISFMFMAGKIIQKALEA